MVGRKGECTAAQPWVPLEGRELSLGQDHSTHPSPLRRTHNKDKGQNTRRASPGRKGVTQTEHEAKV